MLSISNKSITKKLSENIVLNKIAQIAQSENKNVFVVGGYVRDLILKRERSDIDILVIGSGIDFAKTVAEKLNISNVNYYKNFGTAQFSFDNMNVEFVGARRESYDRNTRKPFVEDGTFEDDISRRDFTINTLAVSLNAIDFGKIIDTYDGLTDIKNQIIKTPLDPFRTFDDDPLRIMRAFRFAAQLDFKVDKNIMKAAYDMRNRLSIVSQERITDEFLKTLSTPKPSIGLNFYLNHAFLKLSFLKLQ